MTHHPKPLIGFILAAGEGTRLRPLTENIPKPLVEVFNQPLIHYSFDALREMGVRDFVINAFYRCDQIEDYLYQRRAQYPDESIDLVKESTLLGTGGGIWGMYQHYQAKRPELDFDMIVLNADALFDFKLQGLWDYHVKHQSLATLALKKTSPSDPFARVGMDDQHRVVKIAEVLGKRHLDSRALYAYLGVQIISKEIVSKLLPSFSDIFRTAYQEVLATDLFEIHGYDLCTEQADLLWFDVGTPKDYLQAHTLLNQQQQHPFWNRIKGYQILEQTVICFKDAQLILRCPQQVQLKLENIWIGEASIVIVDLLHIIETQAVIELKNIVVCARQEILIQGSKANCIYYQQKNLAL